MTRRFSLSILLLAAWPALAADLPALLDWSGRVNLSLPVSGVLDTVTAQAGQRVRKGELLASLEPTLYKANLAESRADLARLTEELADAKRDVDRVQELYARTVSSTTELDAAKLRHARAQASFDATQARLERTRRQLAETELRAPFDALILSRQAEPGLVITSQCQPATVFTVARADELIARALVDAGQAAGLHPGTEAQVETGGKNLRGRLTGLSVQADGRYGVEVSIPRRDGLLAGQKATIKLP